MSDQDDVQRDQESKADDSRQPSPLGVLRFEDLARGESEVVIQFRDQHYRLRVTRNGKLILNK